MRYIKFRAWDLDDKKMIYPSICFNEKYVLQLNCEYAGQFNGKTYDTVKLPLMQFTGLTDKNGKEIYEFDIVEYYHNLHGSHIGGKGIAHIRYNDDFARWQIAYKNIYEKEVWDDIDSKFLYVIGNIYENPELLEK